MQARYASASRSSPSRRTRSISCLAFCAPVVAVPHVAAAQVRWDVGLQAGAIQRIPTDAGSAARLPAPGPVAEAHGHVAMVPMVRVGGYVSEDLSEVAGRPPRHFTEAGFRIKVTPPVLSSPWRVWVFAGLGYAASYQPSYRSSPSEPPASGASARVAGATGDILDLPFGAGIGVRLRRPGVFTVELMGRAGLAFTGAMYDPGRCGCTPASYLGRDSFAVALSVGVTLEQ
jgi:hypothetical protein